VVVLVILSIENVVSKESISIAIIGNTSSFVTVSSTLVGFLVTALAIIESLFPKEEMRNIRESEASPSIPGFFLVTIFAFFCLLMLGLFIKLTGYTNIVLSLVTLWAFAFSLSSLTVALIVFAEVVRISHENLE